VGLLAPLVGAGCDIVQGFQNAGDSLFPPQKTYLEAPGFRLTEGNFRNLNVGVGDELYLFARDASPMAEASLYSMRYVDPKPCKLTGVGRYWTSGLPSERPAQVVYLPNYEARGPARFADARCGLHDLVIENADLPFAETAEGVLMLSGSDLLRVEPTEERVDVLARGIQRFALNGPGAHFLVIDNKLEAYLLSSFARVGSVGDGVVDVRSVGSALLFEDRTGVHSVSVSGASEIVVKEVAEGGCRMGYISGSLLAYYSSCADRTLSMYDASTGKSTELDYVADPLVFAVELDPGAKHAEAKLDGDYWYYSLREPYTPYGGGTLVARRPDGEELVLGPGARLERTKLDSKGEFGLALLDVMEGTGRLVRFRRDGTVDPLATNVLDSPNDLIVNWNGAVGDRARITEEGELEILLHGVPRRDYDYVDQSRRWRAIFDESDGVTGRLSIADPSSRTLEDKRVIAQGVRHQRHQFLDVVLPGIAFISNYDREREMGRLEYTNLELDFRGTISEGVSDFIPSGNGILYAVPFGEARGVWIARAQ
jgi:hypothetical protein